MPSNRSIGLGFIATGVAIGALIPVFLVLYPAAGVRPGDAGNPAALLPVMARTPALFVLPGLLQLVGHTIGAIAIAGLWWRLGRESFALTCATIGGLAWMVIDVLDNALALQLVPRLAADYVAGSASAGSTFRVISSLVDAIRLGGHVGGGLWVAGVAATLLRNRELGSGMPRIALMLGMPVGVVLAANALVPQLLNVSFMTLPFWLVLFGASLARSGAAQAVAPVAALGARTA